jgi:guanylate kinase
MKGKLVIISAPSGSGKTTIVKHLLNSDLNLEFSISATTRPIRTNENQGKDYYFLSTDEFRRRVNDDEFIEWEEVYKDHLYGTLKSEIERIWAKGNHVLFDVDVKGGTNLKKLYGKQAISIFVMPPSIDELEKRLVTRGTDKPERIRMRVEKAVAEMKFADKFDHIVINDKLKKAQNEAYRLVFGFLNNQNQGST